MLYAMRLREAVIAQMKPKAQIDMTPAADRRGPRPEPDAAGCRPMNADEAVMPSDAACNPEAHGRGPWAFSHPPTAHRP